MRRLAAALVCAAGRIVLWSAAGARAQRRVAVCSAAGILVALGIRVEVVNAAVPWPRTGRGHLVVSNHVSWLDDLALLIAVRATPLASAGLRDRALVGGLARRLGVIFVEPGRPRAVAGGVAEAAARLRRGESVSVHPEVTAGCGRTPPRLPPSLHQAAVDAGAAVCPVAIRYRVDGGATWTPAGGTWARSVSGIAGIRGLVAEVHLLPALEAGTDDRRALARLAQRSIADVVPGGGPGCARASAPAAGATSEQPLLPFVTPDTTARRSPRRSFTPRSPALG